MKTVEDPETTTTTSRTRRTASSTGRQRGCGRGTLRGIMNKKIEWLYRACSSRHSLHSPRCPSPRSVFAPPPVVNGKERRAPVPVVVERHLWIGEAARGEDPRTSEQKQPGERTP